MLASIMPQCKNLKFFVISFWIFIRLVTSAKTLADA